MLMVAVIPVGASVAMPRLASVELYAWIAQAKAGARPEYHRGFLGIDVTPVMATSPEPERCQLADLGQAAVQDCRWDSIPVRSFTDFRDFGVLVC